MPSARVAIRLASFIASEQLEAVAVPNAKSGKPGLMLPGIVASASALQVQVHPRFGHGGWGIPLPGPGAGAGVGVGAGSGDTVPFCGS